MQLTRSHITMEAQAVMHRFAGGGDGAYCWKTMELLRTRFIELVASLKPQLSLEVGAHEGLYSQLLKGASKAAGHDIEIIAVEANPSVYRKHLPRLAEMGIDYRNVAVSDRAGSLTFTVPLTRDGNENIYMGSVLGIKGGGPSISYEVPCVQLSDLVSKAPFVLWVDVEGANREVFSSCGNILDKCAAIYVEVEDHELWRGQMLADEFISFCEDKGLVAIARDYQRYWQYNMILVRREHRNNERVEACVHGFFNDLKQWTAGR